MSQKVGGGGGGREPLPKINNNVKKKTVEISEKWCGEGTHVERSLSRADEECVISLRFNYTALGMNMMITLTLIEYSCLEARTAQVYDVYRHQKVKACGARRDRLHIQVARGWILGAQTERFPQGCYKNSHAGRVFCDNTTILNLITNIII